ncbi:MAG: hypothetical protein ABW000_04680 [Actinoplanes sp.]
MIDLRNHLEERTGPTGPATVAQADADLARGRKALRRRRAAQTIAGSAFGVAALVAAFTVATTGTNAPPAADRPAVVSAAKLVAYKGAQPKGFTVDKVPDGWFIQSDENYSLVLAPDKAKNPGPDVNPSTQPLFDKHSYVDKITIMLESKDQNGPSRKGKAVKAGDKEGVLLKSLQGVTPDGPAPTAAGGDTGWELWLKQPSGVHLIVQYWQGLGLSEDQMVELGAGVHVHKDAEQTVG